MLPKTGRKVHREPADMAFAKLMAEALTSELGQTHQAVKIAMRWTGASERSVKHWMAGKHAPSGAYLLELIRHSDGVLGRLLVAAGRRDVLLALELSALRCKLGNILGLLDVMLAGAPETKQ
jgi:hypothetical protein